VPKRASDKDALRAFGAAVRELRTERNMSRLDPPFDLMLAVADALGVRVSTIVIRASTHEQRED
jgi:transcriptional regulator with XRE-family HTH domain